MISRIILVTGGSRGLGEKIIERLSSNGINKVYYTYSGEASSGPVSQQNNVTAVKCDQRDEARIKGCVSEILSREGRLDVLVNNACSSFMPCDFFTSNWDMFQDLIDVNLRGSYLFANEAAKAMKLQGEGRIVNILSAFVLNVPPEKISHYITVKYALLGLSKALAAELCKFGITVNMVSPGLMRTSLSSYLPPKYMEVAAAKNPMKRLTTTEDAAKAVEFLISENAQFLNGVNIPVNGGESF